MDYWKYPEKILLAGPDRFPCPAKYRNRWIDTWDTVKGYVHIVDIPPEGCEYVFEQAIAAGTRNA
jgi:hypothetical protein